MAKRRHSDEDSSDSDSPGDCTSGILKASVRDSACWQLLYRLLCVLLLLPEAVQVAICPVPVRPGLFQVLIAHFTPLCLGAAEDLKVEKHKQKKHKKNKKVSYEAVNL